MPANQSPAEAHGLLRMLADRARCFPRFPLGYHIPEVFAALGEEPPRPDAQPITAEVERVPTGHNRPPSGGPCNTEDWNAGYEAGLADANPQPKGTEDAAHALLAILGAAGEGATVADVLDRLSQPKGTLAATVCNDYNADGTSSRIDTYLPAGTALYAEPQAPAPAPEVPAGMVLVPLVLIQRAQQAINWHLEPNSPDEHERTMLELSAIGWPEGHAQVEAVLAAAPAPSKPVTPDSPKDLRALANKLSDLHGKVLNTWGQQPLWDAMTALRRYALAIEKQPEAAQAPAVPHGKKEQQ